MSIFHRAILQRCLKCAIQGEVCLRNAIDSEFNNFFKSKEWFEPFAELLIKESDAKIARLKIKYGEPPKGFNDNEPLKQTAKQIKSNKNKLIKSIENDIRDSIKSTIRKIDPYKSLNPFEQLNYLAEETKKALLSRANPINISHSYIIADTNFSFWTSMFKEDLFKVTKGVLLNIFPNRGDLDRQDIYSILDGIRNFRNRVAHNEPICFKQQKFDLSDVNKTYENSKKILYLLNNDLEIFSTELYMIHDDLRNIESFINRLPIILGT